MLFYRIENVLVNTTCMPATPQAAAATTGIITRNMHMRDFDSFEAKALLRRSAERKSAEPGRQLDVGVKRAARPSGNNNGVSSFPEFFDQLDDMSFAAAEVSRRINLQNAHCAHRNPTSSSA